MSSVFYWKQLFQRRDRVAISQEDRPEAQRLLKNLREGILNRRGDKLLRQALGEPEPSRSPDPPSPEAQPPKE